MWHDIPQNTPEWLQMRVGKIGGSSIGKIMACYGKAFGDPAHDLAVKVAIEQITGKSQESGYTNEHMERGHEQEPIARMMYEEHYFVDVTNGGFFENGDIGVSPDDTGGKRLAPYLLNHIIKNNLTGIERKYVRAGHIHRRGRNAPAGLTEDDGVVVEVFPTIAAPDAYAAEQAYSSIRATVANLWHSEYGQRARIELGVKELLETENKRGSDDKNNRRK